MSEIAVRWPCPVCLGVRLDKRRVGRHGAVVLDHCDRCGGVWFEKGEVQALRQLRPRDLLAHVAPQAGVHHMRCRGCDGVVSREATACLACDQPVRLDCPSCDRPLETRDYQGVRLDFCGRCRGVWFDQHELKDLWRMSAIEAARKQRSGRRRTDRSAPGATGQSPAQGIADVLLYAPDLGVLGVDMVGRGVVAGVTNAPEAAGAAAHAAAHVAGGAVDAAGEVAAHAFGFIVEAICSLF
jgi:Zn-finger nucleic acid-binding protein